MKQNTTLFLGGIRPLPPENRPTGIYKYALDRPTWLGQMGLAGDAQADRRVHGGPQKALHQYPAGHYPGLAARFPEARDLLLPGSIGENLSAPGWDETNVCIGDSFRLGAAVIQVSQPRSPCWKIDQRYGVDGMAKYIDEAGITGWYFRVLEEGSVEPGCSFELIERHAPHVSIGKLLATWKAHRPDPDMLDALAATAGISENWIRKLRERSARLRTLPA